MKLPKTVYVAYHSPGRRGSGERQYLVAEHKAIECIEDDGPTVVGTYQLVETKRLQKTATEKKG